LTKKRFAVLVNPQGGIRRGAAILEEVRPLFAAQNAELEVQYTEGPGHATALVKTLDFSQCDGLCVIGGDGTIHEVVNGCQERSEPITIPLGLIPGGTGNSVVLTLGYATPVEAVQRILTGRSQAVDVARVSMRDKTINCLNVVGWGAVVDISRMAEQNRWMGRSRYTVATLRHLMFPQRRHARLVLDDQILEDEFLFVMGCNTQFTGKGMRLAPHANLSDGKIDVIVLRRASLIQILQIFSRIFDGSHTTVDCVEYFQVRSFSIESQNEDLLNLDGEVKGQSPVAVQMLPGAIRVFV
jgi:YegS/Rv2252/BmrU family lipid kinase